MSDHPAPVDRRGPPSLLAAGTSTFATNVSVAVLSFVNVFVVARGLGPTGRGQVAFLLTVGFVSSWLFTLGVQQANANVGAREVAKLPTLATNSVILAVGLGGAGAGLVALLAALVPSAASAGGDPALRWAVLAAVPMLLAQIYFRQLVLARAGYGLVNSAALLTAVVNVVFNAAFAVAGLLTVSSVIVLWIISQWAATLLMTRDLVIRHGGFGRPSATLARESVGFGLKAYGAGAMNLANYRLDQWILGGVAGSRELGLYSVAVAWAETLFLLPQAIVAVQRPRLVQGEPEAAVRQTAEAVRASVLITGVLTVGLIGLAPLLCTTFFGPAFSGSVNDLRILALGGFGIVALKQVGNVLTAQRRPLLETAGVAVAFALTIGLDILLIPTYGGGGAALASTIAYSAGGVAMVALTVRALPGGRTGEFLPRLTDVRSVVGRLRAAARRRGRDDGASARPEARPSG